MNKMTSRDDVRDAQDILIQRNLEIFSLRCIIRALTAVARSSLLVTQLKLLASNASFRELNN